MDGSLFIFFPHSHDVKWWSWTQVDKGAGWRGGHPPPLVQISTPTPPSGLEGTPPLFLSLGKIFHNGTVKSPWRLDFGLLVHHLWKFSPAASLQFTFLTAMHDGLAVIYLCCEDIWWSNQNLLLLCSSKIVSHFLLWRSLRIWLKSSHNGDHHCI